MTQPDQLLEKMAPMFGLQKVYLDGNKWRWGYANEQPDAQPIELDYGWEHPTQAQIDALTFACKVLHVEVPPNDPPVTWRMQVIWKAQGRAMAIDADQFQDMIHNPDPFDLAELMCIFPGSLGYSQLKSWINEPQDWMPTTMPMAAVILKQVIDSGYHDREWYPALKDLNPRKVALLVDLKDVIKQIRQRTLYIVAASITVMIDYLISGPLKEARKQMRKEHAKELRKDGSHMRKCIHPECDVMVDITKKRSCACKKEHMNYECTHPQCVARAKLNNWPKATHPFGTKIAAAHWEYRAR